MKSLIALQKTANPAQIHPSAIIDEPVEIGAGTRIWHFAHVMSGAQIGADCVLGQGVFVAGSVRLGRGCRVQNHVSLFDGVTCEDEVFIGPGVTFTNVRYPRAHLSRRDSFEQTHIQHRASLGARATLRCGVRVGAYAMVGAGAVVTRDVPAHALVVGVPARQVGWVCECGHPMVEASLDIAPSSGILTRWECPDCAWSADMRPIPLSPTL